MHLEPKAVTAAFPRPQVEARDLQLGAGDQPVLRGAAAGDQPRPRALQELWGLVGTAKTALSIVSAMVVATALLGMVTMVLRHSTTTPRWRSCALGRRPPRIQLSSGSSTTERYADAGRGVVLGTALLYAALLLLQPFIDRVYGLRLTNDPPTAREWLTLGTVVLARSSRACCRPCAPTAVARQRHDGARMIEPELDHDETCCNEHGGRADPGAGTRERRRRRRSADGAQVGAAHAARRSHIAPEAENVLLRLYDEHRWRAAAAPAARGQLDVDQAEPAGRRSAAASGDRAQWQARTHRRLHRAARLRGDDGEGVPAGAVRGRVHPRAAAAGEPDHLCEGRARASRSRVSSIL